MFARKIFRATRGFGVSKPRYKTVLPNPGQAASPWYFTAGPVFTPGADGAILNSKLSKAWQVLWGYAYRVAYPGRFNPLPPSPLYAPKSVTVVGQNIQLGDMQITSPATNSDGTWVNQGSFAYETAMEQAFQYGTNASLGASETVGD